MRSGARRGPEIWTSSAAAAFALCAASCQFYARSPDDYRDATAGVLAAKSDQLKACYDDLRKTDPAAAGTVTVSFKVLPDTGQFSGASVVGGTAHEPLKQCVLKAIQGGTLTPPDKREGDATFTWEFSAPKPAG